MNTLVLAATVLFGLDDAPKKEPMGARPVALVLRVQGEVVAVQRDSVGEANAAAVDRVQRGDRHPQFADALLRIELVGLPADAPAIVDRPDGDSDTAVELAAERNDLVPQILRRWHWAGMRRDGRANGRRRLGGLGVAWLGCGRGRDLGRNRRDQAQTEAPPS